MPLAGIRAGGGSSPYGRRAVPTATQVSAFRSGEGRAPVEFYGELMFVVVLKLRILFLSGITWSWPPASQPPSKVDSRTARRCAQTSRALGIASHFGHSVDRSSISAR
jgi:hypothetical protein